MNRKTFPIGISTLNAIREDDCYYVDKTPHIERLINQGRYYFLSRPRRFGKSLLLDTIRHLFEGNEELFEGLHIHDRWDWSVKHPVVRLSFDLYYSSSVNLESNVSSQLGMLEDKHSLTDAYASSSLNGPDRFANLLYRLHRKTGKEVVVLVDEYDKPILDAIGNHELAVSNRDYLRGLYGVIKGLGDKIRFAFLTGITMFSKMSLFSALNNLQDISLSPRYSDICGYTEHDLETVFASELEGLDRDQLRLWYNGYSWCGDEKVYNPWAILNLLKDREFDVYWSVTGMPSFLYKVMTEHRFTPLDVADLKVDKSFISTFDVDNIGAEALMFQSGYLAIIGEQAEGIDIIYDLDYPNLEVRSHFNKGYFDYLFGLGRVVSAERKRLVSLLFEEDFGGFEASLRALFSAMPHQWQVGQSRTADYEGWYCAALYSCFWSGPDIDVHAEESTSFGRSDLAVVTGDKAFIFEFKLLSKGGDDAERKASEAIEQIKDRRYADKHRDESRSIHLIGAVFDAENRNLATLKVDRD